MYQTHLGAKLWYNLGKWRPFWTPSWILKNRQGGFSGTFSQWFNTHSWTSPEKSACSELCPPFGLYELMLLAYYTPWPNKNASILFGIIFQKLIYKYEKLFHNNTKKGFVFHWWNSEQNPPRRSRENRNFVRRRDFTPFQWDLPK